MLSNTWALSASILHGCTAHACCFCVPDVVGVHQAHPFLTQYPEPITLSFPSIPNMPFNNVQLFMFTNGMVMPYVYAQPRAAAFQASFNLFEYVVYMLTRC